MKRFHIHVGVKNLSQSISFYSALFNAEPVKTKADYAKWMLDDPHINFAVSTRTGAKGVDHLGLQVDRDDELNDLREQFRNADLSTFDEGETTCCYAKSDKSWLQDPAGVAWEVFKTMDDAQVYSDEIHIPGSEGQAGCCAPSGKTAGCCN